MNIKKIAWSNYRRLPDGEVLARNHIVLVGPNDTGKSSVMRVLYLCLGIPNAQLGTAIAARDFTDQTRTLVLTVILGDLDDNDRAAFPDEVTLGPPEVLEIRVEASIDAVDPEQRSVRRYFPDAGHSRWPTREQLSIIGFELVVAARSLTRELSSGGSGTVRSLLSSLDMSADEAALQKAEDNYRSILDASATITEFRLELAEALTEALPSPVPVDAVRVATQADVLDDPLSGLTITVRDGDHAVPLAEQSDGIRALSLLTLLGISQKSAKIVAIDEPETHLHPSAQRVVAKSLQKSARQRVVSTHAPAIVTRMDPLDIVAFGSDRRARQLPMNAHIADVERAVRHWSTRLVEPLTARHIAIVEGPADRILLERVAVLLGKDLDHKGIAVFELEGKSGFPLAYRLFGPNGFGLHVTGLLDDDAKDEYASEMCIDVSQLEAAGFIACSPHLEGMYIDTLGVESVCRLVIASPWLGEESLFRACGVPNIAEVSRDALLSYCGHKKRKVLAALAVAEGLDRKTAPVLVPLVALLALLN